jgi:purine-binding chemotaxis protein CheW
MQAGTMDSANIRQKARQEQEKSHLEATLPLKTELPASTVPHEGVSTQQISHDEDFFQNVGPLTAQTAVAENLQAPESEEPADGEQTSYQEFLCFNVSDGVYGVDIMDIKELIKPREVTEVPLTPSFVSGIISLRGVIIPIIDMPGRLGLVRETVTGRERIVVVRQGKSFSGLMVDEIIKVVRIEKDYIEAVPLVLEGIDRDFVSGIGRVDGRMIILLNLGTIVDIHLY